MYVQFDFWNGGNPYVTMTNRELFRILKNFIVEPTSPITFRVLGKAEILTAKNRKLTDYEKGKAVMQEAAQMYQSFYTEGFSISYMELAGWEDFFREYGKKYGLMREFHENCIA